MENIQINAVYDNTKSPYIIAWCSVGHNAKFSVTQVHSSFEYVTTGLSMMAFEKITFLRLCVFVAMAEKLL